MKHMYIGELSEKSGIRQSTLKFYCEEGLLTFQQEKNGLRRHFLETDIERLKQVLKLKMERMTIPEIKNSLRIWEDLGRIQSQELLSDEEMGFDEW